METTTFKVFVYGSLLRGFGNHRLLVGSELLAGDAVCDGLAMFDVAGGAYPGCTLGTGRDQVAGELYRVDAATLARLDRLEGHPRFYCRKLRSVFVPGTGPVDALVYLLPATAVLGRTRIVPGDWRRYSEELAMTRLVAGGTGRLAV